MAKFKIGDHVKCIDFDGATGRLVVSNVYRNGDDFIRINGENYGAYASRFVLADIVTQNAAAEYEEAMEFERLVNG